MRNQSYFHTDIESKANIKNETVPLQVNCTGVVSPNSAFASRSIRQDYYYIYVLKGKMIMPEETLLPGDAIVLEPGRFYQYYSEGETSYLWVHYTGFEAYSLTMSAFHTLNTKISIGIHKEIVDCFKKMFREFIINDEAAQKITVCLLREIFALTDRYAGAGKKSMPLEAIEYIHGHYRDDIDIEELAAMEHMSCTTFRIVFKKHTGVSPNEYIIAQRVSEACRLLSQTNKSIRAIAAEIGYSDQYYFSRIFKKKVGTSPLKYRFIQKQNERNTDQ